MIHEGEADWVERLKFLFHSKSAMPVIEWMFPVAVYLDLARIFLLLRFRLMGKQTKKIMSNGLVIKLLVMIDF